MACQKLAICAFVALADAAVLRSFQALNASAVRPQESAPDLGDMVAAATYAEEEAFFPADPLQLVQSDTGIKLLKYQNAKCKLGRNAKLLWYPQKSWWHFFFPGSMVRDHNMYHQPHDPVVGRVSTVPCQVTGLEVTSLETPSKSPSEKIPQVTWLSSVYEANWWWFWAYDKEGNSMCRFCLAEFAWDTNKESCEKVMEHHKGNGEFDCSFELDHDLAESNLVYIGHDVPDWWSGSWAWTRAVAGLVLVLGCWACICTLQCLNILSIGKSGAY